MSVLDACKFRGALVPHGVYVLDGSHIVVGVAQRCDVAVESPLLDGVLDARARCFAATPRAIRACEMLDECQRAINAGKPGEQTVDLWDALLAEKDAALAIAKGE